MSGSKWDSTTHQVYAFICRYIHEYEFAPTIHEISKGCHLVKSAVVPHLDKLEKWMWIERFPGKARGMRLTGRHTCNEENEE